MHSEDCEQNRLCHSDVYDYTCQFQVRECVGIVVEHQTSNREVLGFDPYRGHHVSLSKAH